VEDSFIFLWNKIPYTDWWASNVYNGFIRFPVPLFIILSGYLLLDKQENNSIFFSKRFSKVIFPLVAWSIIYWVFLNHYNVTSLFTFTFVEKFFADDIFFHLYFLYLILGLYLITPLLRKCLMYADFSDLHYYLVLWFIFCLFSQLLKVFGYGVGVPVEAVTLNLGLYIIGFIIKKTTITDKMLYFSGFLVIVSILITILGTYILFDRNGHFDDAINHLFGLTSVTYAIGLFILIREFFSSLSFTNILSKYSSPINAIGGATLGIYLLHPMLLHFVVKGISGVKLLSVEVMSPVLSIPLVTFLLVIISLIIVLILQRIPFFRIIVP
jgi:surface polysaccharide O-acyltransferase-like enzyme